VAAVLQTPDALADTVASLQCAGVVLRNADELEAVVNVDAKIPPVLAESPKFGSSAFHTFDDVLGQGQDVSIFYFLLQQLLAVKYYRI
jgi:hypothetical protein